MATLKTSNFKNAEYARTVWHVESEHGETIDQIMRPEYWAHVAAQLSPGDRIEVIAQDNKFFAEFHVFARLVGGAKVGLLRYEVFADNAFEVGMTDLGVPDYKVVWKYNKYKWCVQRVSDGELISKFHVDEKAAHDWLIDYRKTLAR